MKIYSHLTGLRAIAALIVFISHSANEGVLNPVFGLGFGKVGVMLFFLLSGFLMGMLYLHKKPTSNELRYYLVARIARVVPLYVFLIVFSYLIYNFFYSDFYYSLSNLDLFTSLTFLRAPLTFWTIPVEFQFYIVFMFFWWCYFAKGISTLVPILIVVSMPMLFFYMFGFGLPNVLPKYAFSFFLGIVISLYSHQIRMSSLSLISHRFGWLFLLLVFINLPELRTQLGLNLDGGTYVKTWIDPLTWLLVLALFISCVCASRSLSFLNYAPFDYLGKISYGFYLIHYPVLYAFKDLSMPWWVVFFLSFVVTVLLSSISFHLFERPVQRYIMKRY
jgi:peptidoglycan/LPS O-acetylase OafA/YrhL